MEKVWHAKALFWHPDNQKTGNREAYERVKAAYDRIALMKP
jgi:curved DNA-binding protein CbpA